MVIEGLKLAFLGMTVVFAFLILLVLVVHLSSYLLKSYTDEEMARVQSQKLKRGKGPKISIEDSRMVAIISAAIAAHRSRALKA